MQDALATGHALRIGVEPGPVEIRFHHRREEARGTGAEADAGFACALRLDFGDDDTGDPGLSPSTDWPVWPDPFLTGTVGFAVGTSRLSRWSLVFHTFAALGVRPQLTRSVDLTHDPDPG